MTGQHTTPENVGMSSARVARIRPGIQRWIDRGTIAGASMAVARRGAVVYADEMGQLDIEKSRAMPSFASIP